MILNHIHLQVRDLGAAVVWFETIMQIRPGFRNERMATFSFSSIILILDAADNDVSATVGFESNDCDLDLQAVVRQGAVVLEPAANKDWESELLISRVPVN
jgi:hypothetical protein